MDKPDHAAGETHAIMFGAEEGTSPFKSMCSDGLFGGALQVASMIKEIRGISISVEFAMKSG